jgi:hypothetical protein
MLPPSGPFRHRPTTVPALPPPFHDSFDATASIPGGPCPTWPLCGAPGTTVCQAVIPFAIQEPPPRGPPSPTIVRPRLHHHRLRTSAPHLYVPSGAAVDLQTPLPPPSTSSWAAPPWVALPGELPFPLTLPCASPHRPSSLAATTVVNWHVN